MGRAKFADIQRDFHKMRVEQEEAARAAAKYREELFNCKNDLKEATEMARSRDESLIALENEKEYVQLERDRAKANLEKAKTALIEHERVLDSAVRARNSLRIQVAGIGAQVAKARKKAIQEYKANFKDTDNYLELMRDAVAEYKEAVKLVDPNFNGDYYNRLILDEPQTPAPEDLVGFEQLDLIRTPETAAVPPAEPNVAPTKTQPVPPQETFVQLPVEPTADQGPTAVPSQPAPPAAEPPTEPPIAQS